MGAVWYNVDTIIQEVSCMKTKYTLLRLLTGGLESTDTTKVLNRYSVTELKKMAKDEHLYVPQERKTKEQVIEYINHYMSFDNYLTLLFYVDTRDKWAIAAGVEDPQEQYKRDLTEERQKWDKIRKEYNIRLEL